MSALVDLTFVDQAAPAISAAWLNGVNDYTNGLQSVTDAAGGPTLLGYDDSLAYTSKLGLVFKSFPMSAHARPYNAVGDGVADDRAALQAAIDAAGALGGATVYLGRGKTYLCSDGLIMKAGVTLVGQGSRINFALGAGNVYGLRIVTDSHAYGVKVYTISHGALSAQYIFGAPISIGAPNNNGDTVASPNAFQTARGWSIRNVELGNVRDFGPCIQIMGDVYNGVIDGVYIPSSATCSGIHMDWGNVGTVSSADIQTTRTTFNANNCYTTHPHHIQVRNVTCGVLSKAISSDLGASIVRLSGCHHILTENFSAESVTLTAARSIGGDLGFEFAPAAVKKHACKGIVFRGGSLGAQVSASGYGAYIDTFADNVYREQFLTAYVPLVDPLMYGGVVLEDCNFPGANSDAQYGVRITQARGVTIQRNSFTAWEHGVYVDEFVRDCTVRGNNIYSNRETGVAVGFGLLREETRDVTIENNHIWGNGTISVARGVDLVRGKNIRILDNLFGNSSETVQGTGIVVTDSGHGNSVTIRGNHCEGGTTAGYTLLSGSPTGALAYRQIVLAGDNTCHPRVPVFFGGMPYIPLRGVESTKNLPARHWLNPNSGAPTDGTWYLGDKLFAGTPVAGAADGHNCTASGSFGTLAGLTNCATTNTLTTVTMSLAATTVTTTAGTYSVVVASAANLRAGLKCSSAAGGFADATILSVSGTTLQLDIPASLTQAGGSFTTPGVIEGEVISINTGTPLTGALVKKTVGTTVTLSAPATSTESGRTVTYTVPIFKAAANMAA